MDNGLKTLQISKRFLEFENISFKILLKIVNQLQSVKGWKIDRKRKKSFKF